MKKRRRRVFKPIMSNCATHFLRPCFYAHAFFWKGENYIKNALEKTTYNQVIHCTPCHSSDVWIIFKDLPCTEAEDLYVNI